MSLHIVARRVLLLAPVLLACALLAPARALAAWPAGNALLASQHLTRQLPVSVSDGIGGTIVVWQEQYRGGFNLFAQHLDGTGAPLWGTSGIPVCAATGNQEFPAVCSDGAGGAVVAWQDTRGASSDIYAQRIAANGSLSWAADGVPLCTAANNQFFPAVTTDGAGGAVVTWMDGRGADWDVYARRVSGAGNAQWTANGVALCALAGSNQQNPSIVSDGSGGAIVAWGDSRSGSSDVYVQRVSSAGTPQWTANGVAVCSATGDQTTPQIVTDGSGGALLAWVDGRNATLDIYGRHVTSGGAPQGAVNGTALCNAVGDQNGVQLDTDGVGGAFAVWQDGRAADGDLYAQHMDGFANPTWAAGGAVVSATTGSQAAPRIAKDGAGGWIVCWQDTRNGPAADLYAQRLNASGVKQWAAAGVALCTAANAQFGSCIVADGSGGACAVWQDQRGAQQDLYAQRVNGASVPQWAADGIKVAPATLVNDDFLAAIADGAGGAIMAWEESYAGLNDLYAQRVDGNGNVLWGADGVAVCRAARAQGPAVLVSDNAGGAILAWPDYRGDGVNAHVYAQRVSAGGVAQWTTDGVLVCGAAGSQYSVVATTDGAGGAILAWRDTRNESVGDIYARRINSAGVPQWAADGVALCTSTGAENDPAITSDGAGGAIVAWDDGRGSSTDIYARLVTNGGVPLWNANGVALCTDPGYQAGPSVVGDGSGGAIVAWQDRRSNTRYDIYAATVTSAGAVPWTANGVPVCTAAGDKNSVTLVSDGAHGAIAAWIDTRASAFWDIYAQRLGPTGAAQWTADGVPVATASGNQGLSGAVADGGGGAYFTWTDDRNGPNDVYVQHLTGAAAPQFATDGVPITAQRGQQQFVDIVTDAAGGAIVVWEDYRNGSDSDVYGDRVLPSGPVAVAPGAGGAARAGLWLAAPAPNPVRTGTLLRFALPRGGPVTLAVLDPQGRRVRTLLDGVLDAGERAVAWDGRDDDGRAVAVGMYFVRLAAAGETRAARLVRVE